MSDLELNRIHCVIVFSKSSYIVFDAHCFFSILCYHFLFFFIPDATFTCYSITNDEIQPVVAADVWKAANQKGDYEVVELELHEMYTNWAVAQYKEGYSDSLDSWSFSAMYSDGRNRMMFDRRGV